MKKLFFLAFLASITIDSFGAEGDTIWVQSHQNTHWDWNGSWYDTTEFPASGTYERIYMHYTLGCPTQGCSEWDYTTKIEIANPVNDSTNQWFELVRIITPYAGDRNHGWTHEWVIDVTDYAPLLLGEKVIKAHYGGWQDGFTVSIDFEFIEGTPAREVLAIDQIYHGTFKYGFSNDPIESHLAPTDVDIHSDMESAKFRWVASGHSFGGNENCAEFCQKWYKLYIDNSQAVQRDIWRDDCGANPLQPQTGTWVYNRAGWCPGSETTRYDDEVGDRLDAGQTNTLNVDLESYSYQGGAGFDPQWIIECVLFQYGPYANANDISIDDVKRPSLKDENALHNPICNNPEVLITNQGSENVTEVTFEFWVDGAFEKHSYTWNGILFPGSSATVELPSDDWHLFGGMQGNVFWVEATEVNEVPDEKPSNSKVKSRFEAPMEMPSEFVIALNNNGAPNETSYVIEDDQGNAIYANGSFDAYENVLDTIVLDNGCYTLSISDSDCDGLKFFANNDGNGRVWLHPNSSTDFYPPIYRFDEEFGCGAQLAFTVGYALGESSPVESTTYLEVRPNPSVLSARIYTDLEIGTEVLIYDQRGSLQQSMMVGGGALETGPLAPGVYLAVANGQMGTIHQRFVILK